MDSCNSLSRVLQKEPNSTLRKERFLEMAPAVGEDERYRCRHIVMLPFMAQGHLIPFLALARKLHSQSSISITIASTPLNIQYLKASSPVSPEINFSELPFTASDHGLPPNAENTESLPLSQIINLFYASTCLKPHVHALVGEITAREDSPPLCIISDIFLGWANEVADAFGTVNITFNTGGAYGMAAYSGVWLNLPQRKAAENGEFMVPGFPESCPFHVSQLHRFLMAADETDPWSRFFQTQIGYSMKSSGWLCNTAEEIELLGLQVLRRNTNSPVWPIGPLLPPRKLSKKFDNTEQHSGKKLGISTEECFRWLDSHPEKSVLFICFGSQNTISETQMMALAKGLEESNFPFIWIIRPPLGFNAKEKFRSEWLPEGFAERNNKGLLVQGWAPQPQILSHPSTAAFLSHCGWNSVMESLSQGVPLIAWPIAAEQGFNAKMLVEELGVCLEIARGVESSVTSEKVRNVIEEVMRSEEIRRNAKRIGELIGAAVPGNGEMGTSDRAVEEFLAYVSSRKFPIGP